MCPDRNCPDNYDDFLAKSMRVTVPWHSGLTFIFGARSSRLNFQWKLNESFMTIEG